MCKDKKTWTIRSLIKWTSEYFKKHSIQSARLDAEVLLAHVLGVNRLSLYLDIDKPLHANELKCYREFVKRRVLREPIAYIIKKKEFFSLDFAVTPDVLIPRPETEILIQGVLDAVQKKPADSKLSILDIGTGSGNIPITLSKKLPSANILTIDCSQKALSTAYSNAAVHKAANNISFVCGNLFDPLHKTARFEIITSNPPYIPTQAINNLEPEIHYEPKTALDGNEDGLVFIKAIIEKTRNYLMPGGILFIEIGHDQADEVKKIANRFLSPNISFMKDYNGIERIAVINK